MSLELQILLDSCADDIRAQGWLVAVHNDYTVQRIVHTFWLFTHPRLGRFVKGEGVNDATALNEVRRKIREFNEASLVELAQETTAVRACYRRRMSGVNMDVTHPVNRAIEALSPAQIRTRVDHKEGWIELGYVSGMPEFTVLQINLIGDYRVSDDELRQIIEYVDQTVSHTMRYGLRSNPLNAAELAKRTAERVKETGEGLPVEGDL